MSRSIKILSLIIISAIVPLRAGSIDTLHIYSPSMDKTIPALVILPDTYADTNRSFPTVYLLHGYSGNYLDWSKHLDLRPLADRYQFILVCPDGGYNSWYLDSPLDPKSQYETHIIKEVIPYVDQHFRSIAKKEDRAITGLSMGGHGALYLAVRHPGLFSAAGSMSGGVDLASYSGKWEIAEKLGSYKKFPQRWYNHSLINMIGLFQSAGLGLFIDCGVNDFFIKNNRTLHQKLVQAGVAHDYIERPGGHSWQYWVNALEYHLLFFSRYFKQ